MAPTTPPANRSNLHPAAHLCQRPNTTRTLIKSGLRYFPSLVPIATPNPLGVVIPPNTDATFSSFVAHSLQATTSKRIQSQAFTLTTAQLTRQCSVKTAVRLILLTRVRLRKSDEGRYTSESPEVYSHTTYLVEESGELRSTRGTDSVNFGGATAGGPGPTRIAIMVW